MIDNMKTIRAENVELAIEEGLKQLGLTRDEVEVHVISEGKKGFLGFGKQDAVVEVRALESKSLNEILDTLEDEEETSEQEVETVEETVSEPAEEEVTVETVEVTEVKQEAAPLPKKEEKEDEKEEDGKEERQSLSLEESTKRVAAYIQQVIETYGARASVTSYEMGRQIVFEIETDKTGLVIGKHGKIINSLQILAQTKLLGLHHRHVNVVLNVGDYRKRRANVLKQMADDAADEVAVTRQPVIMDPLPAYERKQIHAHLAPKHFIRTYSEGKEPNRHLVIEYKERDQ